MIEFSKQPGQKILELGAGDNPHPQSDVRIDVRPGPYTHFQVDFEQTPWPVASAEFDGVIGLYVLEHLSFRRLPAALAEILRVLKPGGKAVFAVPNTEAQCQWIQSHQEGWDGKDLFEAASELLFGSQDYAANAHKCYFTPILLAGLLRDAGFVRTTVSVHGERGTDLLVEATKDTEPAVAGPEQGLEGVREAPEGGREGESAQAVLEAREPLLGQTVHQAPLTGDVTAKNPQETATAPSNPSELFDKDYFNGGKKVGGYAGSGYSDFPCHWSTLRHILDRRPESVLEIGAARGYLVKRLQDWGVKAAGLEVSRHCWLTRVADLLLLHDLCRTPWPLPQRDAVAQGDGKGGSVGYDLLFSCAVLEHVPERHLPGVIKEMVRTAKRGLHGIDYGEHDDSFDRTHCTLRSRDWWLARFAEHAPGWPVEIVNKEELEKGDWPLGVREGDGKFKVQLGSFTSMNWYGWENVDIADLAGFAQANGCRFRRHDVSKGLPYQTGTVDLLFLHHVLEHFDYESALSLLRECRRVVKPTGAMRIAVPDAETLMKLYNFSRGMEVPYKTEEAWDLSSLSEMNDGVAAAPTSAGKLWALLHAGHQSCFDADTLEHYLTAAGWRPLRTAFRKTQAGEPGGQILRECTELALGGIPLFIDALPLLG